MVGKTLDIKLDLRKKFIDQFISLHEELIPWNTIRYIF
jgi:hypothetical protein